MVQQNNYLSIKQVADILDCTPQKVYVLIWSGRLIAEELAKPNCISRRWQVHIEDLDSYIKATGSLKTYFEHKLSTKEAAKFSGLSWMHINKLLRSGRLKAEKEVHGKRSDWKIDKQDLLDFLAFRKTKNYRKGIGKVVEKVLDEKDKYC